MNFINELFFGTSIAHSVFIIAIIVAIGVFRQNKNFWNISWCNMGFIYRNTFWAFRFHRR